MAKVGIVIAHPTDLVLIGAQAVLASSPSWSIMAAVNSLPRLLEALMTHQPMIAIIHAALDPEIDLLYLVESIKLQLPNMRVIVMGSLRSGLVVQDVLDCGASAYLYESDELQACVGQALEAVLKGRPYLSPTASAEYLVAMQTPQREWRLDAEARVVLRLLGQGQHVGRIAYEMKIPLRRVYWVREKLRQRFGAQTNEHLMSRAAAEGYVFS